jgi:HEAT repeat protein
MGEVLPPAPASSRMSQSILYAKSLSLLLEEVQSAADLTLVRSGLLRVRRFSRSHDLRLELLDGTLAINGIKLTRPHAGLQRLITAMTAHGVAQINVNAGAVPRELLKMAMLLSRPRTRETMSTNIFEELRDAALWDIQCYPAPRARSHASAEQHVADIALDSADAIMTRGATLTAAVATAVRDGNATELATLLDGLVVIETAVTHKDLRPAWTAVFDQAATREALQALVTALPTAGDAIGSSMAVLKRSGDVGAEILIDGLLASESMDVRRACFDALIEVRRGTDKLLTMLEDPQWFVVRNAALLLGEFGSRTSEPELTTAMRHGDERVRAAVVTALLRLNTTSSRETVRSALRDVSPEVRRRAVRGFLAETGGWTNVDNLLQALERETELDVQLEFLYAMGTLATPDAVQKLIRLCSTDGRNRPSDFRIAAAEALASARLGAAVPMLKTMLKDPDEHARAAARHLIRAVS